MNRPILGMLFALACVPILIATSATAAPPVGQPNNGFSKMDERYLQVYESCWHAFHSQCGRNRVDDGNVNGSPVTAAQERSSTQTMERWLNPPAPEPAAQSSAVSVAAPTPAAPSVPAPAASSGGCSGVTPYEGGGQCWAIPYSIVQCESGGQDIPNSQGSGAEGFYQLMSGGTGDKASQDAAAAALWNGGAGAGAWVCAG
jgi:hypothetical protein